MSTDWSPVDPIAELRFVFAEADTVTPDVDFRSHLLNTALAQRPPGYPTEQVAPISGLEAYRRMTHRFDVFLSGLAGKDWTRSTIRGLDVQGLVGHLIGVDDAFARMLAGDESVGAADHVQSTEAAANAQCGRSPDATHIEWRTGADHVLALLVARPDHHKPAQFHRLTLPLDALLVARAFELWTHEEDIRRATGRPLVDPEAETLTRMTDLATAMLPFGIALAGHAGAGVTRLVLTGSGGGTWDVPLDGSDATRARPGARYEGHVVVDAAAFCRVAANRTDLPRSGAMVSAGAPQAQALFAGAAALALD